MIPFLFVPCFFMIAVTLTGQKSESPLPGKQVVQSVELPASTSTWDFDQGMRNIGEPRPLDESETDTMRYWLFLPSNYGAYVQSGGAPLLLFLHGAGERGTEPEEINKVKVHGPAKLLDNAEFAKKFPCITVSPQCKKGFAWSPAQLMLLLDHIEKNYKIDKSRVYVTGLSMGGFGTWMCLNESPNRFAAAAPICGGAKVDWAEKMTDIPIWAFHGDKDPVVTSALSEKMVEAIKKTGGKKVVLTLYEGEGHDSWTRTYNNQMLFDWMFQQTLEGVNAPAARRPIVEAALQRVGVGAARGQTVEREIGDGKPFKVLDARNDVTEKFTVAIAVQIAQTDARDFDRRYNQCKIEIIDRIVAVLRASTTAERQEAGLAAIKERLKSNINEVLGTPWVQAVFCTGVEFEMQ
jgi:poly(3-hydroxybutyrate) depolymerase